VGRRRQSEAARYHGAMRGLARRVKEAEEMAEGGARMEGFIRVFYDGCMACIPPEAKCLGHVLARAQGDDVQTVLRAMEAHLDPEAALLAEGGGVDVGRAVMVPEACSYCFGAVVLPSCPYCFQAPPMAPGGEGEGGGGDGPGGDGCQ
jgi:hypothetical protein